MSEYLRLALADMEAIQMLRARAAKIDAENERLCEALAAQEECDEQLRERIAELERLGDAMSDELAAIAGADKVCGLCHVYSDNHKGNCSLNEVAAWRAYRGGGK